MSKRGRVEVKARQQYQEISIRLLRNYYVIIPLIICAIVWVFGFILVAERVSKTYKTVIEIGIAGMLFFWVIFGAAIFSTLYWIFRGKEKVMVTSNHIQTEKPIHLYRRRRSYPLEVVSKIRIDREVFKIRRDGEWVDDTRIVVKFEIPNKSITFGRALTQQEAEFIIMELAKSEYLEESHFQPVIKV